MPVIGNKDHIFPYNYIRDWFKSFFRMQSFQNLLQEYENHSHHMVQKNTCCCSGLEPVAPQEQPANDQKVNQVIAYAAMDGHMLVQTQILK